MNKNTKISCLQIGAWLILSCIYFLGRGIITGNWFNNPWYVYLLGGAFIGGPILLIYHVIKDFENAEHKLKYLIGFIAYVIFYL
jgi:hypothetical protein